MASPYIGVYKAVYDYTATTEEELSIAAGDLLYLLQKSDIDDWWTAKKRLLPQADLDVEEPTGLIPANYIEPAPAVGRCVVLYDYAKQTDEELSFLEGDAFDLYDLADPDWLLAGSDGVYGFIPSNYVRMVDNSAAPAAAPLQPAAAAVAGETLAPASRPISAFAPPPVHKDRVAQQQALAAQELDVEGHSDVELPPPERRPQRPQSGQAQPQQAQSQQAQQAEPQQDGPPSDDEGPPPPMPTRPGGALRTEVPQRSPEALAPVLPNTASGQYEPETNVDSSSQEQHGFDGEYFRWYIDEVDGRKKRPIVLAIGNGLIIIKPKSTNPKKLKLKSASLLDNNWRIRDLSNYNHEKKHVFLDLHNPDVSIELHAGSKDVAEAIVSVLGDLKGAEAASGLKEVARAALAKHSPSNKRVGRLLYDFKAQSKDELLCRENDEVFVVDLNKSAEWWLCERVADGRQGVVPSSYIEIVSTTNLDKLTDGVQKRKSQKPASTASSKGKVVAPSAKSQKHLYRTRDDRDKIRERDKKKRDKSDTAEGDNMPNFHRVRTWIDSSGTFKVEAEFLGCVEGKVHLHKTNGVKIAVSATKLSIEDLEYVEKVTGTSLQKYKDEVAKQIAKRDSKAASSSSKPASAESNAPVVTPQAVAPQATPSKTPTRSATAVINDVPPEKPSRSKAPTSVPPNEPDYDWFDFFLTCGVDIGNCQRYSINFSKEQMDESILEDITPSLLRSLGLREGDILRVMKHLNNKFDRKKLASEEPPAQGSLFTEATGALKNNSTTELSKVNASALPTPSPIKEDHAVENKKDISQSKIEDDAWAVKPAARSSTDVSKAAPRPQYTGSLQDLVDVKPLEMNKTSLSAVTNPATMVTATPSAPPMTPVKTGTMIQPNQQFSVQKTGSGNSNPAALGAMRTGGLIPVPTGGLIPVQPTGFIPILAQPTGFVPIQATGGLVGQPTFGFVPLQTGNSTFIPQKTGQPLAPAPVTSFGQAFPQPTASFVPLQPGTVTQPQGMPLTTFGQQPTGGQYAGSSNGLGGQITGQAFQNTFVPQSTFGRQITGGFMGANQTGGAQVAPLTSFGNQTTGGQMPQTFFGSQMTGGMMPQTSFGNQPTGGMMPLASFGAQMTGGFNPSMPQYTQPPPSGVNQATNMFQNTSLGGPMGQQFGQQPTASFAQQPMFSQQPTASFNQQPLFGQQPIFGQQPTASFGQGPSTSFGRPPIGTFGQQPNNSFAQQSYGQQSFNQQPAASFGQDTFEGFNNQPLQSQPTGLGFGNAPNLQSQATGRRANLQAATADNPFGF
ncbi:hypothetical protein METBIDRAFT_29671 [Metschnikowia bicuspidata var. bicuspidata NRRL YB-4993]|uniref:Actin cytoskeleton-regulatory complex protein SLA1 n=1 Tax=Metschnikowia bicuspidata var. bicuspidata NRRL YB-4993 TaxID=869754 RepID=A0A1A0HGY4_9ASCO|nr:hypothetical protein METBIDRAFT_29671 [Metschnikowia bicuspidata var. bicuspidata NRRL YB-4993]OBA23142.1 hypothetical protein METBIDRAFT_29671 [Metschnikowia bicuspidata var. bicuspidata NRRL YB-4993]